MVSGKMIPKFRAWHKGSMMAPALYIMRPVLDIKFDMQTIGIHIDDKGLQYKLCEPEEVVLMQWIGLDDINNVPIFEGDIVEFVIESKVYKELIRWCKHLAAFRGYYPAPEYEDGEDSSSLVSDLPYKVIGNIFENKDLLL